MSEWQDYSLGEIVDVAQGLAINSKTKHVLSDFGLPLLRITDLINNTQVQFVIKELVPKQTIANEDDIIYTRTGQVGLVFKGKIGVIHNNCFKVLPKVDFISMNYIYWFLRQSTIREFANSIASGSVQKDLNHSSFKSIKIKVPKISTQTAIAEILSSLDDKIELNNKINKELEALAQTLFKQWFIDFEFPNENGEPYKSSGGEMVVSELGEIPKDWRVGSIYDISSVIYGAPFKSSLFNQEKKGYPLIRIRDLKTFKPQNWTEETHSKGTKIQPGDLVVGMDAEFRPHFWLGEEGWLNQRVCLFKPKSEFSRLFVREIIRPRLDFFENSSVGTTVIHLGKGDIDTFRSIIPDIHLSKLFTELSEPLINKVIENSKENESLRNTRDTLLPKLISGELEINEISN